VTGSDPESSKRRRPAARAAGAGDERSALKTAAAKPAKSRASRSAARAEPQAHDAERGQKGERRVAARAAGSGRSSGRSSSADRLQTATDARTDATDARTGATDARTGATQARTGALYDRATAGPPLASAMEADLAGLLNDIEGAEGDSGARERATQTIGRIASRLSSQIPAPSDAGGLMSSARQWLSSDYYFKQLGRIAMRGRSEQVDDFGLDPVYDARAQPLLDLLYQRYFRVQIEGAANIPEHGAALLVCNHAGTLPWDGVMLKTALRHARPERRGLRWLTDDFVFHSPFLGPCLNRIGAVRACPENADRLLERGELLAVFPEGIKGIGKLFRERYQLQRFGRGGHIKLALRMQVPLIPLAIVGSEESYPLVYRMRAFSKVLGMPFIPITPLFPWLGPLGLLPLPSRWHIVVGEPMREFEGLTDSAAEDSVLVNDLNEQVRSKVNGLLQHALQARGPAF
jgi:1-acyl-sn-glycerol-3-phosphate acyltransferase